MRRGLRKALLQAWASEDGWVTPFSLLLFITFLGLGGIALDVSHVMTQRTQLQVTADSSAHAAILTRLDASEAEAKTNAVALADANMPFATYGTVLNADAVVFGTWDHLTRVFTPMSGSSEAVMVRTLRHRDNQNAVPALLLRIIGFPGWNVDAYSVFTTRDHPCFFNGVLADNVASFQSNSIFRPGFCIHGNGYVSMNQNNTFEAGSIVSMPDLSLLDIPASGMEGNPGLEDALRTGYLDLSVVEELPTTIAAMQSGDPTALPGYTTNNIPVVINNNAVTAATFEPGRVYNVRCNSNNGTLTLTADMTLTNVVVTTNCSVQLGNGAAVSDSIIASTSTSATSISGTAGSGAQASIGTACAPGPGTQVLTLGGMRFPAKLIVNGGQFVAAQSINFTAQATIEGSGVSMVAGENVDWTSNAEMSVQYCDELFDGHLAGQRIRMVN